MRESIEKILGIADLLDITPNQSLYLFAHKHGMLNVQIPATELVKLVNRGYIEGNRLTQMAVDDLDTALKTNKKDADKLARRNALMPKLTQESANLVKNLVPLFMANRLTGEEVDRMLAHTNNYVALPYLYIFLEMFPTADSKRNRAWNSNFQVQWDGVTLRKCTSGTVRKFNAIWKSHDIGLFLMGTYLFVIGSYDQKQDRFFLKSIDNYLKEWKHWYNEAKNQVADGKLDQFTKQNKSNTFVI